MHLKVWLFLLFVLVGFSNKCEAQISKANAPLHKFLQENFDSTIIYYSWSNWYIYPNYLIISKKDSSVYFFTYKSPFTQARGRYFPGELNKKFTAEESKFRSAKPDTNIYFWPVIIDSRVRTSHWIQANSFNIWNVEKEKYEPGGCEVYDGAMDTYYLITKSEIKVLDYYDPDFFETCKPKSLDRQNIIKTREVIKKIFGN